MRNTVAYLLALFTLSFRLRMQSTIVLALSSTLCGPVNAQDFTGHGGTVVVLGDIADGSGFAFSIRDTTLYAGATAIWTIPLPEPHAAIDTTTVDATNFGEHISRVFWDAEGRSEDPNRSLEEFVSHHKDVVASMTYVSPRVYDLRYTNDERLILEIAAPGPDSTRITPERIHKQFTMLAEELAGALSIGSLVIVGLPSREFVGPAYRIYPPQDHDQALRDIVYVVMGQTERAVVLDPESIALLRQGL